MAPSWLVATVLGTVLATAPTPATGNVVRTWELVDGPFVATATVGVGGVEREGEGARFTVEKGGHVTVTVDVCGPSAPCTTGVSAPAPSPIGMATEPSGLRVAAHLTADPTAFSVVGGGFTGEQMVGQWAHAAWSWTLRADAAGEHVVAVQVAAWRVNDGELVGDGKPVEFALQTANTVRDFLGRRVRLFGPGLGVLVAVALAATGLGIYLRRRATRSSPAAGPG
jgi:hypothetical protein